MNAERWAASEIREWMTSVIFLMPNWKWIGLVIAFLAGLLLKSLLKKSFVWLKTAPWTRLRVTGFFMYFLETELQNPAAWVLTSLFWVASLESLELPVTLDKYLTIVVKIVLCLNLILLVYRAAEAFGVLAAKFTARTDNTLDDQLVPMATKVLKVFVVVFGVLISLENLGIKVMPILAGLGLGGLALALAAQDTAANLFGSITIVLDRPFRIGDYIKIGDVEGAVEEIGFRSTRLRTPYKSLITIPNSLVAKERIDNLQFRPQRRIRHVLDLTYDAKESDVMAFMAEMESFCKAHPKVDQTSIAVNFQALGSSSLQVLVQFFLFTTDWNEEMAVQQDFLFHAMKAAEKLKVDFAFPTRTQNVNLLSVPEEMPPLQMVFADLPSATPNSTPAPAAPQTPPQVLG